MWLMVVSPDMFLFVVMVVSWSLAASGFDLLTLNVFLIVASNESYPETMLVSVTLLVLELLVRGLVIFTGLRIDFSFGLLVDGNSRISSSFSKDSFFFFFLTLASPFANSEGKSSYATFLVLMYLWTAVRTLLPTVTALSFYDSMLLCSESESKSPSSTTSRWFLGLNPDWMLTDVFEKSLLVLRLALSSSSEISKIPKKLDRSFMA